MTILVLQRLFHAVFDVYNIVCFNIHKFVEMHHLLDIVDKLHCRGRGFFGLQLKHASSVSSRYYGDLLESESDSCSDKNNGDRVQKSSFWNKNNSELLFLHIVHDI